MTNNCIFCGEKIEDTGTVIKLCEGKKPIHWKCNKERLDARKVVCECGHVLDKRLGKWAHKKRIPPIFGGKRCVQCNCTNPNPVNQSLLSSGFGEGSESVSSFTKRVPSPPKLDNVLDKNFEKHVKQTVEKAVLAEKKRILELIQETYTEMLRAKNIPPNNISQYACVFSIDFFHKHLDEKLEKENPK